MLEPDASGPRNTGQWGFQLTPISWLGVVSCRGAGCYSWVAHGPPETGGGGTTNCSAKSPGTENWRSRAASRGPRPAPGPARTQAPSSRVASTKKLEGGATAEEPPYPPTTGPTRQSTAAAGEARGTCCVPGTPPLQLPQRPSPSPAIPLNSWENQKYHEFLPHLSLRFNNNPTVSHGTQKSKNSICSLL